MIRITTDAATDTMLRRYRASLAAQLAGEVEGLLPPPCDHRNDRPSCPRCSARRTVIAAARIVRDAGGVSR